MFVRNGQMLGSIQVDPSTSEPRKQPAKKAAVKVAQEPEQPALAEQSAAPAVDPTPAPTEPQQSEPEPTPEPESKKAAPAKKAAGSFKSALDKPKG